MSKKVARKTTVAGKSRMWTNLELMEFARILSDKNDQFFVVIDKLALKKSSNNDLIF